MDVQIAKENAAGARRVEGGKSLAAKIRGALAASAWGSLVGKGFVYVAGFLLPAAVGSGKIHCLAAPNRAPATAASAAPLNASAPSAPIAPSAVPESTPAEGARTDAGSENHE